MEPRAIIEASPIGRTAPGPKTAFDLDGAVEWRPASTDGAFEGRSRASSHLKWTGRRVDLAFGSTSELRSLAEVSASDDAGAKFVRDFLAAWSKAMNLDRFDLA